MSVGAVARKKKAYRGAQVVRNALIGEPGEEPDDRLELTESIHDIGLVLELSGDTFRVFFFKQKTAYDVTRWLEFRRVLFRSGLAAKLRSQHSAKRPVPSRLVFDGAAGV